MLNYDYIFPSKIVYSEGNILGVDFLLNKKTLQTGVYQTELTVLKGKCSIILDFGKELQGGVRIITHILNKQASAVRIRFGESVSETLAELGERGACNDHSPRDFNVNLSSMADNIFGQTGFRFIRIDSLSEDADIQIKCIVSAVDILKTPYDGSFNSDDKLLNDIFDTAAYTLRLCMQNGYFWDGIKRDRLVWIGDLYPEMRAAINLFSKVDETYNSLKFAMEETPLPYWVGTIPMYSLWWIIIYVEHYFTTGNLDAVYEMLPYAKGIVKQVSNFVSNDGTTNFHHNFIDWPSHPHSDYDKNLSKEEVLIKQQDELSGVYYLTKICFNKIKELFLLINEDVSLIDDVLNRLSKNKPTVKAFKQIAGLGVFAGDTSKNVLQVLKSDASMSTFMSYFILSGLAEFGEYDYALKSLKDYYGGMLSVGATSFWEDFDLSWLQNASRIDEMPVKGKVDIHGDKGKFCYQGFRHSFCHGWSSGVVAYLIETVLGVKPIGVGRKRFTVKPHLSTLNMVEGTVPTPYGNIYVKHTKKIDGSVDTVVKAPDGVEVLY